MVLLLVAYLGGVLTIVSPCILPVLPFVFARADQPFIKSGLPMLLGMAVTFAGVATLAAVGGGWAVQANQYGRLPPSSFWRSSGSRCSFLRLAERLTRPLVAAGARLSKADGGWNGIRFILRPDLRARRRHRPALGALRGADSGPRPDGRRP